MRSPCTATKSSPRSPQLEKKPTRSNKEPNAAKNKLKNRLIFLKKRRAHASVCVRVCESVRTCVCIYMTCVCCCLCFRVNDKALIPHPYMDVDNFHLYSSAFLSPSLSILITSSEPHNPLTIHRRWIFL